MGGQEPPKKPNKHQNTSPKGPKRGPKEAKKGSEVDFDASSLKNAQPSDFTVIYNIKCMSEVSKSSPKTAKFGPSDWFLANL